MTQTMGKALRYIRDKFDKYLRWERYKNLFHITVFRYLVLWFTVVPLLASLFRGLKTPLQLTVGQQAFTLALSLPFSWQMLWMSSLFFFLALMVYQLRCPSFIKRYNSFADYQALAHDQRWLAHETKFLVSQERSLQKFTDLLLTKGFAVSTNEIISEDKNPSIEEQQSKFRYRQNGKTIVVALPVMKDDQVIESAERGLFWEIFARYSGSRTIARATILLLLFASAACFAIVLCEHIIQGMRYVIEWLR